MFDMISSGSLGWRKQSQNQPDLLATKLVYVPQFCALVGQPVISWFWERANTADEALASCTSRGLIGSMVKESAAWPLVVDSVKRG